jgi:copper chaperone CopZ
MKIFTTVLLLVLMTSAFALDKKGSHHAAHNHHSHEGHFHGQLVDGEKLQVDPRRFDNFIEGLSNAQVAVVDVNGMVCDFCARGIEKTFKRDKQVKKIDVDLSKGKVLIAYTDDKTIKFAEIEEKIVANGQNATGLTIVEL